MWRIFGNSFSYMQYKSRKSPSRFSMYKSPWKSTHTTNTHTSYIHTHTCNRHRWCLAPLFPESSWHQSQYHHSNSNKFCLPAGTLVPHTSIQLHLRKTLNKHAKYYWKICTWASDSCLFPWFCYRKLPWSTFMGQQIILQNIHNSMRAPKPSTYIATESRGKKPSALKSIFKCGINIMYCQIP